MRSGLRGWVSTCSICLTCMARMRAHAHTLVPGAMDAKNKACVTKSLCRTLREFIEKGTILGFGFGIPCYVAGTAMFCACYACCCCRQHFVGAEDATSDKGVPPITTGMIRVWDRGLFSWFAMHTLACFAVKCIECANLEKQATTRIQTFRNKEQRRLRWGGGAESWETSIIAIFEEGKVKTSVSDGSDLDVFDFLLTFF
jgi:hypothetical protein